MVLLCEYSIKADQHALAFTLSGSLFRSLRLLGFDTPSRFPVVSDMPSERLTQETENRLAWACFHLDLLLSSGVDKHSLWRDDFPRIPLPCSNQDFLSLCHSTSYFLSDFESPDMLPIISQLDLPALSTILIRLRSMVLRYFFPFFHFVECVGYSKQQKSWLTA